MNAKSIFLSKTFWVNVITVFVSIAGYASGMVPPEWQAFLLPAVAIANIVLRAITNQPVTITS